MRLFWLSLLCLFATTEMAGAQLVAMSPQEARKIIDSKILPPQDAKATAALRKQIDYISESSSEAELRKIILNMEKLNRKVLKKMDYPYAPYDRRIDVKDPEQVKRFFRSRIDTIY